MRIRSPGLEREDRRGVGDEQPDAEDEVGGVARLEELAVQPLDDPQPAAVAELGGRDELGAERAEGVEPLRRASTACRSRCRSRAVTSFAQR